MGAAVKKGTLSNKRIVVTRSGEQADAFKLLCEKEGAEVLTIPLIKVSPAVDPQVSEEVFQEIATYEWIIFTSANGVKYFFEEFFRRFQDIRCFGGMRIACVGESTARAVKPFYLSVELIPEIQNADSLADALIASDSLDSANVLVVTGNLNREELVERLDKEGRAIVDTFQVYKTEKADLSAVSDVQAFKEKGADIITFASPSAVDSFVSQAKALALSEKAQRPAACSIGPVTSEAMRKVGMPVDLEAKEQSLSGMLQAITAKLS